MAVSIPGILKGELKKNLFPLMRIGNDWLSPSGVMMVPSSLQLPATECLPPGTVLPVKSSKILKVRQQQLIQSPLAAMVVGSLPQRMTLQ